MSFWGCSFIFDGIPCEGYDLMLYNVSQSSDASVPFASSGTIVEEPVGQRWKPYFYGVKRGSVLQFDITFGVNQNRIDTDRYLDRYEISAVSSWLTGHEQYKWLTIDQPDMSEFRFRCIISNLSIVTYGNIPWAMTATVRCDSPYAYLYPQEYTYPVVGSRSFAFDNMADINGYFYPTIVFRREGMSTFEICNDTDNGYTMAFSEIPDDVTTITVDNDRQIISWDGSENPYEYFNLRFFRLKRGPNQLTVSGYGVLSLICEFPVNTGG